MNLVLYLSTVFPRKNDFVETLRRRRLDSSNSLRKVKIVDGRSKENEKYDTIRLNRTGPMDTINLICK